MKEAATVVGALRRAIADERQSEVREESGAAYAVGFERGFAAGWEAAERDGRLRAAVPLESATSV